MIEQIPGMISGDFDYEEVISMVNEYLIVGTVINTHGVKGELKVNPITSDVSRFDYLTYVSISMDPNLKSTEFCRADIIRDLSYCYSRVSKQWIRLRSSRAWTYMLQENML